MIVPDLNLLLYAYDSSSPYNKDAVTWWRNCMSGTDPVGLPTVIIFGFIRLSTSVRVFQHPMTPSEAAGHVRSWLSQPTTQVLDPGPHHVEQTLRLLEALGAAGNLVTDAQLAAIAIDHSAILHTADADFARFPDLQWTNPIAGTRSSRQKRRTQRAKKK
jgi:toxin-antitoxin system PIN domain toxin